MFTQDDFGGRLSKFKEYGILINKHKTKSKRDYVNIFTREREIQTLQVLCETPCILDDSITALAHWRYRIKDIEGWNKFPFI